MTGGPMTIRVLLHALDRTGPPMLARSFARWLRTQHPDHEIEVVAFRGGPLIGDFAELGPVHVLLDPHEAWDHGRPRPDRVGGHPSAGVRRRPGRRDARRECRRRPGAALPSAAGSAPRDLVGGTG